MDFKRAPWKDILLVFLEIIIIGNILLLDFLIFKNIQHKPQAVTTTTVTTVKSVEEKDLIPSPTVTQPSVIQPSPIILITQVPQKEALVKEFFIPLGSGQESSKDWKNIPGAVATIESASYPTIKSITLESSVHNITSDQIINLRIFDTSDNHAVYNSDISFSGKEEQFGVSQSFALDGGIKQYQLQIKTQLEAPVSIDMSRIHILLN